MRCAVEVQTAMIERNVGVPPEKRIEFRVGVHVGDVVEESDGDLMGDGVNIAARLEGIAKPGAICLSEDAYRQVKGRLDVVASDLGPTQLKNIAEPVRIYALDIAKRAETQSAKPAVHALARRNSLLAPLVVGVDSLCVIAAVSVWLFQNFHQSAPADPGHLSIVVLPFANLSGDPNQEYFADGITENLTTDLSGALRRAADRAREDGADLPRQERRCQGGRQGAWRPLCGRGLGAARSEPRPR